MTPDLKAALAIEGFMSPGELEWLATRAAGCRVVVEVGCWRGRSTRALADALPQGGKLYAVDLWSGVSVKDDGTPAPWIMRFGSLESAAVAFRRNLRDHIRAGRVEQVVGRSPERLFELSRLGVAADMVFVDGDHRLPSVEADIDGALALLAPGGLLCGHDYGNADWPGVAGAVDRRFGTVGVNRHETIWWVRQ